MHSIICSKEIAVNTGRVRLKSGDENDNSKKQRDDFGKPNKPAGRGAIDDQNPHNFTMNTPSGATSVHFDMYSHSVIGSGHVTISSGFGGGSDYFLQVWVFGGNCDIKLPVSGNGTIYRVLQFRCLVHLAVRIHTILSNS